MDIINQMADNRALFPRSYLDFCLCCRAWCLLFGTLNSALWACLFPILCMTRSYLLCSVDCGRASSNCFRNLVSRSSALPAASTCCWGLAVLGSRCSEGWDVWGTRQKSRVLGPLQWAVSSEINYATFHLAWCDAVSAQQLETYAKKFWWTYLVALRQMLQQNAPKIICKREGNPHHVTSRSHKPLAATSCASV